MHAPTRLATLALVLFATSSARAAPPHDELAPTPSAIVEGIDVGTCGYPSVGAYGWDAVDVACSLVLVAPDVVLTAAHCLAATGDPTTIHFGERYDQPDRVVAVEQCGMHPFYVDGGFGDLAFCVLEEPIDDIPITPILAGCELDLLAPGATLEIVGFGANSALYDPDLPSDFPVQIDGTGFKRKTTQWIEEFRPELGQVWLLGDLEHGSACFGDSGGPAFVTLPDGETRVVAISQMIHPETPSLDPCGYGSVYQLVAPHVPWLEALADRDLTPCWTDATWTPGPTCGGFARMPELELGEWTSGCLGGGLGGVPTPQCESSEDESEGDTTADTGADESASDDALDDTSEDGLDESVGSFDWSPAGRTCTCSLAPDHAAPRGFGLLALALLALVRRRGARRSRLRTWPRLPTWNSPGVP